MEESEKMTALKKAYAEIILNTAKEAALKIMTSERKAHQFQHDLSATKEEALRLLLRVKQTMDAKIKEAEMKSQFQQNRIDELEAQLQEAEDIVGNLRSELNEAHMRLEETAKAQKCDTPDTTGKNAVCVEKIAQHVNVVSQETVLAPGEKHLCNGVSEAPSIIARNKEHELCRNGCTQRIRAYEGMTLSNGHFSLSDDRKNDKTTRENKAEDNPVKIKEVILDGKPSYKVSSLIRRKRKKGTRYRRSYTFPFKSIPPSMAKSFDKDKQSLTPSNEHKTNAKGEDEDTEVANSLVLIREQSVSRDCLDAPSSTPQVELESVQSVKLDSEVSEKVDRIPPCPPAKERVLKYTFQRKRKRETLTLSSDNSSSLNQENALKRKTGKKLNGCVQPTKSSAAVDMSRDSRRMAQVARQLISLSEKKWWK